MNMTKLLAPKETYNLVEREDKYLFEAKYDTCLQRRINFNEASKSWKKKRSRFKEPKMRHRTGLLVQCITAWPIFKGQLFPVKRRQKMRMDAINGKIRTLSLIFLAT